MDLILFHEETLKNKQIKDFINKSKLLKICASKKVNISLKFDAQLKLPATLNEINSLVENVSAKQKFSKNSSIEVKDYLLDKNEKKLYRKKISVILTEKEVQLIELFKTNTKPISKDKILSLVWNYAVDADTHTVETHIYRLRKKISDKFMDNKFILNNKDGYFL